MDSISFYFAVEVVSHLKKLGDVQTLGGVWRSAALEEANSRIICSLGLSPCGRVTYYGFVCEPGGRMSFEEVKKLNPRRLRVRRITLSACCNYKIEEELLPELLSFVNRYLTYGQRLIIMDISDRHQFLLQSIYSLRNVREVVLWYRSTDSERFLLQLLRQARPEVLRLKMGWPLDTLDILTEEWAKSGIRDIYIDDTSNDFATLQQDLNSLRKIYQLWMDGFFVTRRLDAVFLLQHDLSVLDTVFGPSIGDLSSKKWCFRHSSQGTFELFAYWRSELRFPRIRILIA
uniref:FBA_2 domain-containing protein n=1 Tax=Steinernema glaseri TaxID=37863 RepID=A0A1I7Y6P9_9BILA